MEIDADIVFAVRNRLGTIYDELVGVLLDVGQAPLFLFSDDRPRVIAVRERAAASLRAWDAEEPGILDRLVERLPQHFHVPDSAEALLESVPSVDYFALPDSIFEPPVSDAPVFAKRPALYGRLDDDGLLEVNGLDAGPYGIFDGELSIHYHQLLRRGFGSSIHYDLIGTILGIARTEPVAARIAIDERRCRLRDEHEEIIERDYWYGPPLDDAVLDDPFAVGETVHGDPRGGSSLLHPYVALSVRWTRDGHLKTVEIEELVPTPGSDSRVLARYLHAIRDTTTQCFVHCDGAVKAYESAGYPTSVTEFAGRGRSAMYRKVFRLDGSMSTDSWSMVAGLWFRGNQLILEYLSGLSRSDGGDQSPLLSS
jgi:hypothetical protein